MPITALPTPPTRQDPANFAVRADAFLAALPAFQSEANALAVDVNADEVTASAAASTATTQADIATTQAGIATTGANTATTKAAEALASADAAAASFDSFDDRYLGTKASDPTLDNDGNALLAGAMYWNSSVSELRFWSGSAWLTTNLGAGSYVAKAGDTMTGPLIAPNVTITGTLDYDETVSVISGNTTAVKSRTYVLTATLTLTLPISPSSGDWVKVVNRSGVTTAIVGRNSQNIMGLAENMTLDDTNAAITLMFADATRGWILL